MTGNDAGKAERFKHVSEAHAVLSDDSRRREYDATRPFEDFGPQNTQGASMHPYARGGAPDLRARRMYGIDEAVWLAHHYGPEALRREGRAPPRYYGMNVVEERMEQEEERIRRCGRLLCSAVARVSLTASCDDDAGGKSTTNCTRPRAISCGERRGSASRRPRRRRRRQRLQPRRPRSARSRDCRPRNPRTAASLAEASLRVL